MPNDELALMSAILADPADDTPRLIYADWLEEQGDADRAEFIRDCVWMHANHTDCPVRLSDLGRGRPVPLRCGICEYCTRRRRAEKFYAKHPWIEAPSYAVAFEPTPLDGAMPTCHGLTLVIQRGFVAEVHTKLQTWMGGKCEQCEFVEASGYAQTDFYSHRPGGVCKLCNGSGTIPGHGPAIVSRHPVERVVISDAVIHASSGMIPTTSVGWDHSHGSIGVNSKACHHAKPPVRPWAV